MIQYFITIYIALVLLLSATLRAETTISLPIDQLKYSDDNFILYLHGPKRTSCDHEIEPIISVNQNQLFVEVKAQTEDHCISDGEGTYDLAFDLRTLLKEAPKQSTTFQLHSTALTEPLEVHVTPFFSQLPFATTQITGRLEQMAGTHFIKKADGSIVLVEIIQFNKAGIELDSYLSQQVQVSGYFLNSFPAYQQNYFNPHSQANPVARLLVFGVSTLSTFESL